MSDDLLDWPEEMYDGEDVDDFDVDLYIQPKKLKAARARRKLERRWDRKRLAEDLYDVFTDARPRSEEQSSDTKPARRTINVLRRPVVDVASMRTVEQHDILSEYNQSEVA